MASVESSNRNVAFHKIPKLKQFLQNANELPRCNKYGKVEYSLWFNAFSKQLEPHHNLDTENGFQNNTLEQLQQAYKKICMKINTANRQYSANGKFELCYVYNHCDNSKLLYIELCFMI